MYKFDARTIRTLDLSCIAIEILEENRTLSVENADCTLLHQFYEANTDFTPFETITQISELLEKGQFEVENGNGNYVIVRAVGLIAKNSETWDHDEFPHDFVA